MTKKQRLHNLEERIGQLEVHIRKTCPIKSLWDDEIDAMSDAKLDVAIKTRMAWLRANNEKERMGRRRY